SAALNVLGTPRDEWALAASRGCATAFWLALSIYTRLARCHHKSRCASTTPGTVSKPQRKPKTPWRARCFSGMRWSGCGTGLQHPSNRSCVLFVDARQHRDRAWYIEAIYDPFAANDRALRRVGLCAAMRDRAGSVAAPAASCRKFRRGSFSLNLPSHHSITSSARKRKFLIRLLLAVVPDIGCELPVASDLLPHHEIFAGDFFR